MEGETSLHGVIINSKTIKCLGIYIGHDEAERNEANWLCTLREFEKILDSWRSRKLTIFGKCQIINSLLISKILYNASILENPEQSFIKSLNKIIFSFIWGNRERIKRKTLIRSINEGGIGITDFESKISNLKSHGLQILRKIRAVYSLS